MAGIEDKQVLRAFLMNNAQEDSTERRRHTRKPFRLYVKLTCDRVTDRKQARDISLSGIFVEGVDNIAPGKEVELSLPFSNQGGHIKMKGRVVRATEDGVGIHFDIFSIDIE